MKFLLTALLFSSICFAQTKDPNAILDAVINEFDKIEDYEVDVLIKIDLDFLKVPESNAKIYFKKPDKVKLDADGFALLPKQGLNFSPEMLLKNDYTAIYSKADTIDGKSVDVIKVIPSSDTSEVVLTTLWIDELKHFVRKIETTTKRTGTFSIGLEYDSDSEINLPSKVEFSFNVGDLPLPKTFSGELEDKPAPKKRDRKKMKGSVSLFYSNYKINQGLPDSFFDEEEEKKEE